MNRVILIGNGFDLAHGLETSYKQFFDDFWEKQAFDYDNTPIEKRKYLDNNLFLGFNISQSYSLMGKWHDDIKYNRITLKNRLLEAISEKKVQQDWVDIEEEYNKRLLEINKRNGNYKQYLNVKHLNQDFLNIKKELEKYLTEVVNNSVSKIEGIYNLFYDNFKIEDFPSSKEDLLMNYISEILNNNDDNICYDMLRIALLGEEYKEYNNDGRKFKIQSLIEYFKTKFYSLNTYKIYPRHTLILNFNYTKTESLYLDCKDYIKNSGGIIPLLDINTIHIHGELNSETNPIIFGYGDELSDGYKEIEKLNDNDFLKNIKSIKYLKTDNYRQMLNFIDSDYYQIYTFGHSCGNSDRTLLNTLFEHENCVSIKPFFHEKEKNEKKTDNYEDIIINMSRNFNDKKIFREKVVNKTYCEPLPQIKK